MNSVGTDWVWRIGETAGKVWHLLHDQGPLSPSQIVARLSEPRDLVMQSIGWLAREDKLHICQDKRRRLISLKE